MGTKAKPQMKTDGDGGAAAVAATPVENDEALLSLFRDLAVAAGREILRVYEAGCAVERKTDQSPVTEADRRGEAVILAGLRASCPELVCVAEEEMSGGHVIPAACETFILVDPLDGTREFIARNGDFTVNIALVRGGVPVLGVVYAPVRRTLYAGQVQETGGKAWVHHVDDEDRCGRGRRIGSGRAKGKQEARGPARIVASRSHRTRETDDYIGRFAGAEVVSVGSSLKFCLLAAGKADLYPRFGRTMEWDTAAGDAILRAAGGATVTLDGAPLTYGKRDGNDAEFANPWFIASARSKADAIASAAAPTDLSPVAPVDAHGNSPADDRHPARSTPGGRQPKGASGPSDPGVGDSAPAKLRTVLSHPT